MSIFRFLVLTLGLLALSVLPARAQDSASVHAAAAAPPAPAAMADESPVAPGQTPVSQTKAPPLPAPIQSLADKGAQLRYLGREGGLDGWIAIQNGQEQYFYVTPDQESFVLGLQFDKTGKVITLRQVQRLQKDSGADVLSYLADGIKPKSSSDPTMAATQPVARAFKTPSEQLFSDLESSNWIPLGNPKAPYIYMIIDPQCPYCKKFLNELRANFIPNNAIQVRIVPVGFRDETMAQAAFLLAAPNPQELFYKHLDGDDKALPISNQISTQGVQKNMAVMQTWKLNATPTTVYRDKKGQIKIIQGVAKDIPGVIADLQAGS